MRGPHQVYIITKSVRRFSRLCKLVVVFTGFFSVTDAKAPTGSERSAAVSLWVKKYASTSAYLARAKNYPKDLMISDENLRSVLQGQPKIIFPRPFHFREKVFKKTDLDMGGDARRLEVLQPDDFYTLGEDPDEAWALGDRQKVMLQNMENLVRNRPADQLLILDAGAYHGLDLYFGSYLKNPEDKLTKRRSDIFYFISPLQLDTFTETDSSRKLDELINGIDSKKMRVKDKEASLYVWFLGRLRYYQNLSRGLFTETILKQEAGPGAKPGVLVFLDSHGIVATEVFEKMPSARDWKALGFKSVTLATEIFTFGKTYDSENFEELYYATNKSFAGLDRAEEKIKKWVKQQKPLLFPAQKALHEKLKEYAASGLSVTYTGLEPFDRLGFKPKKESEEEF